MVDLVFRNPMVQSLPTSQQVICYHCSPTGARTLPCLTTSQSVVEWLGVWIKGNENMMRNFGLLITITVFTLSNSGLSNEHPAEVKSNSGELSLKIIDAATNKTLACRVHLVNAKGKPQLFDHLPSYRDHFCCDGEEILTLPTGRYTYVIERGPEHNRCKGSFEIKNGSLTEIKKK